MIYIFDGEDAATSRLKLTTSIDKEADVVRLDGKRQSLSDVADALAGTGLFTAKKTVIIEHFSKIKTQAKLFSMLDGYIKDKDTNIFLWESTAVKSKETSKIGIIHYTFDFPKLFYAFLDGLVPKSSKRNVLMAGEILKTMTAEQLFFALTKRVRYLLYMKGSNYHQFSEIAKMAPWQQGKIRKQAAFWTESELKEFLLKLAATDEAIKTSTLPTSLTKHLDILLLRALN